MVDNSRLRALLEGIKTNTNEALAMLPAEPPPPPPPPPGPTTGPTNAGPSLGLPGLFLRSDPSNSDWQVKFGALPANAWSKVFVSYVVTVGDFDEREERHSHTLLWLQPSDWPSMLGYILLQRDGLQNRSRSVRFRTNATTTADGRAARESRLVAGPGSRVFVGLEATPDTVTMYVGPVSQTFPLRAGMLTTKRNPLAVLGMGTFETPAGPEARTYGWEFSDLAVEWTP